MKIRQSFVTNSSSSSYIVVYQIDNPELYEDFVKDEFGKRGLAEYKGSIATKEEIIDETCYNDLEEKLEDNKKYAYGWIVSYTNEGDTSDWIHDILCSLPKEANVKVVYEGEDY